MEIPLLKDVVLIFGLAVVVLLLCHRIKVASVVGLLVTGIIAGPYGLGLITAVKEVELLAEIGIVLLLFTIGIEFSLENLLRIKRAIFAGGALQVGLTIGAVYVLAGPFGLTFGQALFTGFVVSLSSTAIVLRLLQQRGEVETPHGQTDLAILIFQDMVAVPMVLALPFLDGGGVKPAGAMLPMMIKGGAFVIFILAGAKWLVPKLLHTIAQTRSRELFMLSVLVICFTVAFFTQSLGLSLAIGAFLAGLIISQTPFSHETLGNMLPFRDVFTGLFFVSIGMLMDTAYLIAHPAQILLITLGVMLVKALLTTIVTFILGFPLRPSLMTGFALCQIGEFSFILLTQGNRIGLLEPHLYQLFLNVSVLSMGITPFAMSLAPRLADALLKLPLPMRITKGLYGGARPAEKEKLRDHLIIIGYGFNGRNLAHAAKVAGVPSVIIEMNPQTVKEERKKGNRIFYGDASQPAILEQAEVGQAKVLVIAISDPVAGRRITVTARRENPALYIIARTRFIAEMKALYDLGANEVIPEEFETSIEIFSRVLNKYLLPTDQIQKLIANARADGYQMFRTFSKGSPDLTDLKMQLPDTDIVTFLVTEDSPLVDKSLAEIGLRRIYGATLLAVQRDKKTIPNPPGDTVIRARDLLMVLVASVRQGELSRLFRGEAPVKGDQR